MKTTEFNQPLTAAQLNENMFKKFGARVEFDKYTREELENYRNLLRTKVDQHEKASGFNDLLTNETYQKDKYMLGVLNTKIKEMLGESVLAEKAVSKAQQKFMGMVHAAQKGEKPASPEVAKVAKGMSKKAAKDYASTKHKGLPAHKTKEGIEETTMKTTEAKMKKAKKDYDGDGKVETEKDEVWGSRLKAAKKAGNMEEAVRVMGSDTPYGSMSRPQKGATPDSAEKRKDIANQARAVRASGKQMRTDIASKAPDGTRVMKYKSEMEEGFEDKLDAAREKAAAKGKTKEKETAKPESKSRTVAGKSYGGSKQKDEAEVDEASCMKPKKSKKVSEARARAHYTIIIEGLRQLLKEDEEGKAKDITAGTDMVNDFTSWMQRIGQYQTKSMIELSDSIRANFGQAEADAFKNTIQPALAEALSSLTQARETITRAVATLAGESAPEEPMGSMGGIEEPLDVPPAAPDAMNPTDEFGASDAAVGGEEVSGRGMRESRAFQRAQRLAESHSIISKLAK